MSVPGHILISVTAGGLLYYVTRSIPALSWFLITGVLIDIDHYIDYARENGLSFDLKKVYVSCKYGHVNFKNLTIILHSYELAAVLWLVIFLFGLGVTWKSAAAGLTLHLVLDAAVNPLVPAAYFLWFRIANDFETKKINRASQKRRP